MSACPKEFHSAAEDNDLPEEDFEMTHGAAEMQEMPHDDKYFEMQDGPWCGMCALNNFLGGPYVTKEDCTAAARRIVEEFSQATGGDREDLAQHFDLSTGWLSIDVINRLGSAVINQHRCPRLHVQEAAVPWEAFQHQKIGAALVNWNNEHWTVLETASQTGMWRHRNSMLGPELRHGQRTELRSAMVQDLLDEIAAQCGFVSLHRIVEAVWFGYEAHGYQASIRYGADDNGKMGWCAQFRDVLSGP